MIRRGWREPVTREVAIHVTFTILGTSFNEISSPGTVEQPDSQDGLVLETGFEARSLRSTLYLIPVAA